MPGVKLGRSLGHWVGGLLGRVCHARSGQVWSVGSDAIGSKVRSQGSRVRSGLPGRRVAGVESLSQWVARLG
jgi:hypothetical protein